MSDLDNAVRLLGNISSIRTLRNKTIRVSIDLNEHTTHDPVEMNKLWAAYNVDAELEFVGFGIDGKAVALVENNDQIERLGHFRNDE